MSDTEMVKEFLVESYENLDRLDQELVLLEKKPGDSETLASIFRTIHTIKGTCGFLGFTKLEAVAHAGENLLSKLRDGAVALTPEVTTALLAMVDAVRQMLGSIGTSGHEGERDDAELISTLAQLTKNDSASQASVPVPNIGELLIQKTGVTSEDIRAAVEKQAEGDPRHVGEILVEAGVVKSSDVIESLQAQQAARAQAASSDGTIRVDVGLLDKLMNLVGELVLARNQILQFTNTSESNGLVGTSQRLNLLTTELQENVMKTRMQPIGNIWSKFPRTVRDVAVSCGKEVGIEMDGRDTELDKTIIEAIKDPLTHLVRNAVDHGIEPPEIRVAIGKPREGRLHMRAFHEGGQVNIEISDDGAGLDLEKLRQKALQKGLVTPEQLSRMTEREVTGLIFGVVMTGMGADGVLGSRHIREAGGKVIVQDEATSIVWGMPGMVATSGYADGIYPLEQLGPETVCRVEQSRSKNGSLMTSAKPMSSHSPAEDR